MARETAKKTVLVIGGGSGVGRATVRSFAARGARVVAAGRDLERLERVRKEAGERVEVRVLDATDARSVEATVRDVAPDVVVLSAGVHARLATVDEHTWESFSAPWNTDLKMAFEVGQAALRAPLAAGSSVVFVSSGAGLGGSPLSGGYAGAKRMQMFLATYLQQSSNDRGLGIRFVAVVPKQLIDGTDLAETVSTAYAARLGISREKFMDRFGAPLDADGVARAIAAAADGEFGATATILGVTGAGTEVL
jgi:NAD(P)-dependent dehydrogenase (short-subunit alcohol dehydrogenase family)